jgi:hypothetical protein
MVMTKSIPKDVKDEYERLEAGLQEKWAEAGKMENASEALPYTRRRQRYQSDIVWGLFGELRRLRLRIEELEKSPLDWKGVWAPGSYESKSVCTHGGSCWYTPRKTNAKPGEGIDWVMIVKGAR